MKILFLHGLDSSRESTKFHAILHPEKFCIDVDYRNLSYASVEYFYHQAIQTIKPDLLVGHSLGGYWALKTAAQHKLAVIVANPSLTPSFRPDYPQLSEEELTISNPKMASSMAAYGKFVLSEADFKHMANAVHAFSQALINRGSRYCCTLAS